MSSFANIVWWCEVFADTGMPMKNKLLCALAMMLSVWTAGASAANVTASMIVTQPGGLSWEENLSSLVDQLNGGSFDEPDFYYAVSAINNSSQTRTYTFTLGSAITPMVGGASSIYAELSGSLTGARNVLKTIAPVGSSGIQRIELSSDNGNTFFSAGVDVGQNASSSASSSFYGLYSANNPNGLTGQTWNYVRFVSEFTLSGASAVSLSGFASIKPVPEPVEAAMLVAGLALLGAVARKRRAAIAT